MGMGKMAAVPFELEFSFTTDVHAWRMHAFALNAFLFSFAKDHIIVIDTRGNGFIIYVVLLY